MTDDRWQMTDDGHYFARNQLSASVPIYLMTYDLCLMTYILCLMTFSPFSLVHTPQLCRIAHIVGSAENNSIEDNFETLEWRKTVLTGM